MSGTSYFIIALFLAAVSGVIYAASCSQFNKRTYPMAFVAMAVVAYTFLPLALGPLGLMIAVIAVPAILIVFGRTRCEDHEIAPSINVAYRPTQTVNISTRKVTGAHDKCDLSADETETWYRLIGASSDESAA